MNEPGRIKNDRVRFIVNIAFWVIILAIVYFVLTKINQVLPLVIALIMASLSRPLYKWMVKPTRKVRQKDGTVVEVEKKHPIPQKLASVLSVVALFTIILGLVTLVIARIVSIVIDGISLLPGYYETVILPGINDMTAWIQNTFSNMDEETVKMVQDAAIKLVSNLGTLVTDLSGGVLKLATSVASKTPNIFLNSIVCVIATVFFAIDYDNMKRFIRRLLPERPLEMVRKVKDSFVGMIWNFLKSYALIFAITVAEITVGLLLCRVKNPLLIAMLIGIFDAFPIVGSGLILAPWGIITIVSGATWKGIGLLILWLVVVVAREILEPKIVGTQVGLRPLVTLVCMYVGNKLFGIWGLFGLPIAAAIIMDLDRTGVIHIFRNEKEEKKTVGEDAEPRDAEPREEEAPPAAEKKKK